MRLLSSYRSAPTRHERGTRESSTTLSSVAKSSTANHQGDTQKAPSPAPPRWKLRYIIETNRMVLRTFSDVSGRCYHKPIMLTLRQWEHKKSRRSRLLVAICSVVSCLWDTIATQSSGVTMRVEAKESLTQMLEKLKIKDGGLYTSNGSFDSLDQMHLEFLLSCLKGDYTDLLGVYVCELRDIETEAGVVWMSECEFKAGEGKALARWPGPKPSAVLLFERVVGKMGRHHRGATIDWELKIKVGEDMVMVDNGTACVAEPVPVIFEPHVALADCELSLRVEKNRRPLGKKEFELADIPFSDDPGNSKHREEGNQADTTEARLIALDTGRVVHFRLFEKFPY